LLPKIFDNRALRIAKSLRSPERFIYYLLWEQGGKGLYGRRVVDLSDLSVYHDVIFTDINKKDMPNGTSIATEVLRSAVPVYKALGIKKIELIAGLSHGGFLWPRYGFRPIEPEDWENCKPTIRRNLRKIERDVKEGRIKLQGIKIKGKVSINTVDDLAIQVQGVLRAADPTNIWFISDLPCEVITFEPAGRFKVGNVLLRGSRWKGVLDFDDKEGAAVRLYAAIKEKPVDEQSELKK
jgi:hypothetical protein